MRWKIFLTLLKGKNIDEELCNIIDYIVEENLTYRKRHGSLWDLTDHERLNLSELARRIKKKNFDSICTIFKPETVIGWYRKILKKSHTFNTTGSKGGRPSTLKEIERKLVEIAKENRNWGCGKLQGALKNLGHKVSTTTIARILKKHGIPPIKDRMRRSRWHKFIQANKEVLFAGDFLTVDILSKFRVKTYFVLIFIHVATRKVYLGGITTNPNGEWLQQIARNMTMADYGPMENAKYLILDNDGKFRDEKFRNILSRQMHLVKIPRQSPNLNAFAERWVRSIKEECLDHLILLREKSLWYAVTEYIKFYNNERNHQSMENQPLTQHTKRKRQRLGGLLRYYGKDAA